MYPRTMASMGNTFSLRTCIERFWRAGRIDSGTRDGRSRVRKCVRRVGTLALRSWNQWVVRRVRRVPLLGTGCGERECKYAAVLLAAREIEM